MPVLHTPRLLLRVINERFAPAVLDYYSRNRDFHQPWFASRDEPVFTLAAQKANLAAEFKEFRSGQALPFWLFKADDPQRIIGRFAFTNIIRGCFYSCFAAYHLDRDCQGSGLASEAGQAAISCLFNDLRLHRIEANIMPANRRSISLAERLGFRLEGLSPRYLQINGRWEDHLHYVRLADDDDEQAHAPAPAAGRLLNRP